MELEEAFLLMAAIIIMVLLSIFLEKYLTPKTKLKGLAILFLLMTAWFVFSLIERFSYTSLIVTLIYIIVSFYNLYRQYAKFKKDLHLAAHSSSVE